MPVYLDHNATTALEPRVLEAMLPYMQSLYGNPSSLHRYGRAMRTAVEHAREQLAGLLNAQPEQIFFTSGGTEANNLALRGYAAAHKPGCLLISAIEHPSLREPAFELRDSGWSVDEIPVSNQGVVDTDAAAELMRQKTPSLVSLMHANNETGAIQPLESVAAMARSTGTAVHSDASQTTGKIPVDFKALGIDMLTVSAHKFHGPPGVGALVLKQPAQIKPLLIGGGHEQGMRAGTENLPAIVGFGAAAELARQEMDSRAAHMSKLKAKLEKELHHIPEICIFAEQAERLPGTVQFGVRGCHGETLLLQLDRDGIAVSSGSACHSDVQEPSHVLLAMGVEPELALTAIRVSLGKDTNTDDIDCFISSLNTIVQNFRTSTVRVRNSHMAPV